MTNRRGEMGEPCRTMTETGWKVCGEPWKARQQERCNNPMIGSYNNYHLCNRFLWGSGVQRDIGIDSNQTGGINEIKYRRRQQVIE